MLFNKTAYISEAPGERFAGFVCALQLTFVFKTNIPIKDQESCIKTVLQIRRGSRDNFFHVTP